MRPFDLVVLDLDGTLLDPDREAPIRPAVRQAIARVLQLGVGITLASGRTWEYSRHRIAELGLNLPVVAGQGATLAAADGRILWESRLPAALGSFLFDEWSRMQPEFSLYLRHRHSHELAITLNRISRPWEVYAHLLGPQVQRLDSLLNYQEHYEVLKFVVFDEHPQGPQRWQDWAGPEASVLRTHHLLVEGTAPGVNKGSGLERLLQHLGIAAERVLAIGDNFNDLPMFRLAGCSVAMGQAPEAVRQAAHWVAPSFAEDGVAAALEHFLLKG